MCRLRSRVLGPDCHLTLSGLTPSRRPPSHCLAGRLALAMGARLHTGLQLPPSRAVASYKPSGVSFSPLLTSDASDSGHSKLGLTSQPFALPSQSSFFPSYSSFSELLESHEARSTSLDLLASSPPQIFPVSVSTSDSCVHVDSTNPAWSPTYVLSNSSHSNPDGLISLSTIIATQDSVCETDVPISSQPEIAFDLDSRTLGVTANAISSLEEEPALKRLRLEEMTHFQETNITGPDLSPPLVERQFVDDSDNRLETIDPLTPEDDKNTNAPSGLTLACTMSVSNCAAQKGLLVSAPDVPVLPTGRRYKSRWVSG
ncbi:unnamed protein product [Protopolystoma xenopodis]|uniref:Uncharacterized protein n=1 Tax=Protopolystoma xenopodis TaxID=117903 RepID=A0A3S5BDC2_9PLAT|nr:unnamed protein product [Protopolystoma xenopodis]